MNTEDCFEQGMLRKEIIDEEKAEKSLIVSRTFIKKVDEEDAKESIGDAKGFLEKVENE